MLLALVGYRGVGKSTVARLVAQRLGWMWTDADQEIERRAGKSVAAMFADDGETAFRDLECLVVAELCRRDRTVLALGGGAVMREENRRALAAATVVWLVAEPDAILARLAADPDTADHRPALTAAGTAAEIAQVLAERTPIYRQCARLAVDTKQKTPQEVADEIVSRLGLSGE
jgi:shikimate kinase